MARVLILVDAKDQQGWAKTSVELAQGIAALTQAIAPSQLIPQIQFTLR
ncbi:MAG: hypothetical protein HC832_02340 [Leptolyngbyaceae cyanobacterium RM1_405_57]|nr:hypothetical protein [Leptolyngbyaceae cyanobacterium RM1_405_57]